MTTPAGTDPRPLVRVERGGGVAVVLLDRPEALNALSDGLREALVGALAGIAEEEGVTAVVLTGSGRAFCAGGDLKAMQQRLERPQGSVAFAGWRRMHTVSAAVTLLHSLDKVTVAAVNGPAVGLGCDLALCCDFVVASSEATFAMSYAKRGLVPDGGGMYYLPRRVGLAKAKELLFSGRTVAAEEAMEIGIADRLVEPAALLEAARTLAEEMTAASPTALALTKSILNRSFELELDEVYALGASAQAICYTTDDHREAVRAFLDSRRRG
ncbi:MAG TPA: enoyl-CoA hydratase/isomerase family protein [Acidimicrobiales bacterium]|nr:enoyl-CoA hydratase/isomerase family protein [Acidimicrobiales bacterium]